MGMGECGLGGGWVGGPGQEGVSSFYQAEGSLALRVVGAVLRVVVEPIPVAEDLLELAFDVVESPLEFGWA